MFELHDDVGELCAQTFDRKKREKKVDDEE